MNIFAILTLLIVLLLIAFIFGFTYLAYWIPNKFGNKKLGVVLSSIIGFFFCYLIISLVFDDQIFSKKDASKLLKTQNIELYEDFKILDNQSRSAFGDFSHNLILKISNSDKTRIINQIKSSKDFRKIEGKQEKIQDWTDRYFGNLAIRNFETNDDFIYEYYKPSKKQNTAPVYIEIKVNKNDNILAFEKIEY